MLQQAMCKKLIPMVAMGLLISGAAFADKKGRGNDDNHRGPPQQQRGEDRGSDSNIQITFNFGEPDWRAVRDYYDGPRFASTCPPGLAKKQNGCMPPGQAKRWAKGRALPREVLFYDLPRDLIVLLPPPPPRHRYVRVDSDILLIAIGTGMVLDGIENLGRR